VTRLAGLCRGGGLFRLLRDGDPSVLVESHCASVAAALFTAARKLLDWGFRRI